MKFELDGILAYSISSPSSSRAVVPTKQPAWRHTNIRRRHRDTLAGRRRRRLLPWRRSPAASAPRHRSLSLASAAASAPRFGWVFFFFSLSPWNRF